MELFNGTEDSPTDNLQDRMREEASKGDIVVWGCYRSPIQYKGNEEASLNKSGSAWIINPSCCVGL